MKKEKKKRLQRLARRAADRREDRRSGQQLHGIIAISGSGFGFVKSESETAQPDIFIPPKMLGTAMDGDEVKIEILPEREKFKDTDPSHGPAGKVVAVLKRAHETLVGELIGSHTVRPMSRHIQEEIELTGGRHGAKRGDWVEIKLLHNAESKSGSRQATVVRNLGESGVIQFDLDAVCAEYDLVPPYTEAENAEALKLEPREMPREDLTGCFAVTIDPTDAKDYDDALGLLPGKSPDQLVVAVHIADVAAWIAPRDKFDKQAARRSFTAYLPGRTLPMLPRDLTARISLCADQESLAHTVLFTLERSSGKILGSRRCHSRIKVAKRLDYATVQLFADTGAAPADWDDAFKANLSELLKLGRLLRNNRKATEKFLELELPEIRILCDEKNNRILGLQRKVQQEADQLVEEFMLAANSAVAAELVTRSIPGLFRVHPEPDMEKVAEFSDTVAATFGVRPGDLTNRDACNAFLAKLPDDPRRPVILSMFLRSMSRAHYLAQPGLHFGLGKTLYSHFTSPIRRYPDLAVHQQLWNADLNQRLRSKATCEKIALDCSAKEENNDNAYYTASDRMKLRYLEMQLDKYGENFYHGVVAKILSGGMLVDIAELGIYGFVPMDSGDYFRTDDAWNRIHGRQSYRCGDYIYLALSQIDFTRGSAIFTPANRPAPER